MRRILWVLVVLGLLTASGAVAQGVPETAWLVYWDAESGLEELAAMHAGAGKAAWTVIYFAAYYDAEGGPFVPEEVDMLLEETAYLYRDALPVRYLSVTNDWIDADGNAYQKDPDLLYRLLEDTEDMQAHADALVALAVERGVEGLEIDYEALRQDRLLWNIYLDFIRALLPRTEAAGLRLRIVLEPGAPLDSLDFPEGPQYAMMCYNLYGNHSGPGPKADMAFLEGLVQGMQSLPAPKSFAIASGGFDWTEGGNTRQITHDEAKAMHEQRNITPGRDAASQANFYDYWDTEGKRHTVWYADAQTLQAWENALREAGAQAVDLWRLGGNGW